MGRSVEMVWVLGVLLVSVMITGICGTSGVDNQIKCFKKYTDRFFLATARSAFSNLTVGQCLSSCLSANNYVCRSVLFYRERNLCVHFTTDKSREPPSKYVVTGEIYSTSRVTDFYQRTCFESARAFAASDGESGCFEVVPGKVLIGVVDQLVQDVSSQSQCQKLCTKATEFVCKAAMYYTTEMECILASQNRRDMPDLYITDIKAIYMENRCASGGSTPLEVTPLPENEKSSTLSTEQLEPFASVSTTLPTSSRAFKPIDFESPSEGATDLLEVTSTSTPVTASTSFELLSSNVPRSYEDGANAQPKSAKLSYTSPPSESFYGRLPSGSVPSITESSSNLPYPVGSSSYLSSSIGQNVVVGESATMNLNSRGGYVVPPVEVPSLGVRNGVEWSGYALPNPADVGRLASSVDRRPAAVIDAGIVDTYAVPSKPAVPYHVVAFNRLLREPKVSSCFSRIFAISASFDIVATSYSLDQCIDLCRLCNRCLLKHRKCLVVGFSPTTKHCALGSELPTEGNRRVFENDAVAYYARGFDC